jgi:dihydropteroate synthase
LDYLLVNFRTLIGLHQPVLMGIVNVTPDSFSDGGMFICSKSLETHINALWQLGTHIIDIGAESTRPNSVAIDSDTEIARLLSLNLPLKSPINTYYSIDTYKAKTAEFALKNGFNIVNDVTGLHHDTDMAKVIADYHAGVIIMHNQTLTQDPSGNIITDTMVGLQKSLDIALKHDINPDKICLDIGIGFGVTPQENIMLINHLQTFKTLGFPIMVGASRKSFINHFLHITDPKKRLGASIAAHYHAVKNGADIIRVHDIDDHKQFFSMMAVFNNFTDGNLNVG